MFRSVAVNTKRQKNEHFRCRLRISGVINPGGRDENLKAFSILAENDDGNVLCDRCLELVVWI